MALSRKIAHLHEAMIMEKWERKSGMLLTEMTVGIVGLGTIGRSLSRKLNALGVKRLLGWNRTLRDTVVESAAEHRVELCKLDNVLAESDAVVIALALAPETKKLIDSKKLSLMKARAFLINVSRGAVVDEEALADAVADGKIAGVALDVFSVEPPLQDPFSEPFMKKLIECDRAGKSVILSPHNAFFTENAYKAISLHVAKNIVGVLEGALDDVEMI